MGSIYNSQIQWQSPDSHKFSGAAPVKNYIAQGMAAVGEAADVVGKQIQMEQNQIAADRMQKAGEEAQAFIDNFEDFRGDNYMDKMVGGAMKIWDDAYAEMDEATARRFEMNNPEATNMFNFKVHEAAVQKTYDHVRDQYNRRLAQDASAVMSLSDPNEMKAAMQHQVAWMEQNSGMRASDLNEWIDKFYTEVAQGAIAQAVGEGRAEDAAALNNDLEFTSTLTPSQRAANNVAIQQLLKAEKAAAAKTTDADKKYKEAVENGLLTVFRDGEKAAGSDPQARKEFFSAVDKFISDASRGIYPDTFMGMPIEKVFPDFKKTMEDVPYDIMMDALDVVKTKILQRDPDYAAEIGRQDLLIGSTMAVFDDDDDGNLTLEELTGEELAQARTVLNQTRDSVLLSTGGRANRAKLQDLYNLKREQIKMAVRPTSQAVADTQVEVRAGLIPWGTKEYLAPAFVGDLAKFGEFPMEGNLPYSAMQDMRSPDFHGLEHNDEFTAALESTSNRIAKAFFGKEAERGSNMDAISKWVATAFYAPEEEKTKLGISGMSDDEIIDSAMDMFAAMSSKGILENPVDTDTDTVDFRPSSYRSNLSEMRDNERTSIVRSYLNTDEGKKKVRELESKYGLTNEALDVLIKNGEIPKSMAYEAKTSKNIVSMAIEESRDPTTGSVSVGSFLKRIGKEAVAAINDTILNHSPERKETMKKEVASAVNDLWNGPHTVADPEQVSFLATETEKKLREIGSRTSELLTADAIDKINEFYRYNVVRPLNKALAEDAAYRNDPTLGAYAARVAAEDKEAAMVAAKANSCATGISPADIIPMSKPIQNSGTYLIVATALANMGIDPNKIDSQELAKVARRIRSSYKRNSTVFGPGASGSIKNSYGTEVAEKMKEQSISI